MLPGLTIDARIVIASVDTYLRFAEAVGRLTIDPEPNKPGLPELGAQAVAVDDVFESGRAKARGHWPLI